MLDPIIYARELTKKMKAHNADAWLVNTGWLGGPYGTGRRIDLPSTRIIINSILNSSLIREKFTTLPVFNLSVPLQLDGVDPKLLDPCKTWSTPENWEKAANDLARRFLSNFCRFTSNPETSKLVSAGPSPEVSSTSNIKPQTLNLKP
jgi:phosphoenolpyruvate carboxykinase (ATP)